MSRHEEAEERLLYQQELRDQARLAEERIEYQKEFQAEIASEERKRILLYCEGRIMPEPKYIGQDSGYLDCYRSTKASPSGVVESR